MIERLSPPFANLTSRISRYIEIPRETSWIDRTSCTRCSCTLDGQLTCVNIHESCARPCIIYATRPISVMYYFSSGTKWLTSRTDKCVLCKCINGQRNCTSCDRTVKIDISSLRNNTNKDNQSQSRTDIDNYRLSPLGSKMIKVTPCVLKINVNSHHLIYPGQLTYFENRCYFCSNTGDRLIRC